MTDTCGAPCLVSQNRKHPSNHTASRVQGAHSNYVTFWSWKFFLPLLTEVVLSHFIRGIGGFIPPDQFRGWLVMAITLCQLSRVSQNNIVTGIKLAKTGRMVI
jgi:hypothetical protein